MLAVCAYYLFGHVCLFTSQGNRDKTRLLYERLLDRTKHVKVWLSYARFEAEPLPQQDEEEDAEQ